MWREIFKKIGGAARLVGRGSSQSLRAAGGKNVLRDNRKSMTPLLFEAVLFLKVNSTYWNERTVKQAMDKVKSEKVQNRLKEDTQHQQLADIS